MDLLLKYSVIVEPDRQRLSRYVLDAVKALAGNEFTATVALNALLPDLGNDLNSQERAIDIELKLFDGKIQLGWNTKNHVITRLATEPSGLQIEAIKTRLRQESETADPGLLRQRNAKISADLETAKLLAAEEMSRLEERLEQRRLELEQTQRIAETDSLTGLYNHGAYDQKLLEASSRCLRQAEPLCLMMLDLDKFKLVNDTHGHLYGDEYLQNFTKIMIDACRTNVDFCCRLGGDEFAIIVFSDIKQTERIAKTILKNMQNRVSIGITQLLSGDTPKSMTERCDEALYESKRQGRGRFSTSNAKSVNQASRAK